MTSPMRLVVDGRDVAAIELADTYLRRLRGMLLRRRLPEALVFVPGGSVHGVGMTRRLDVAMLRPVAAADAAHDARASEAGVHEVVKTGVLSPFGLVTARRGVRAVLEAPAGAFDRWELRPGSSVAWRPAHRPADAASPGTWASDRQ